MPPQPRRVARERVQGVGVEHQRDRCAVHQLAHEAVDAGAPAEAGSHREHIAAFGEQHAGRLGPDAALVVVVESQGHVFRREGRHRGLAGARGRHRHEARPRPQGAEGGEAGRAGLARRSGGDEHPPVIALVGIPAPARNLLPSPCPGDDGHPGPGQSVHHGGGYPDVGDHHRAPPGGSGIQQQR